MSTSRIVVALIAIITTVGAIYYTTSDKEAQGEIVVLLGIAWILAAPRLMKSE